MLLIRNFTFMLFLNSTSTSLTAYSGTSSTVSITVPLPHKKTVYSICGMAYSPLSEFLNSYFFFSYTGHFYSRYLHHIQLPLLAGIFPVHISHQSSSSRLFSALNINGTREHNFSRGALPTDFWTTHKMTGLEGIHPLPTY